MMEDDGPQLLVMDRRPEALGDLRVFSDEVICGILGFLSPRDVCRLACVSSVMCIFCNEEPLWMSLCLNNSDGLLQYKRSWKRTLLLQEHMANGGEESGSKTLQFNGFNSWFLYKRLYRCYTRLDEFSVDSGVVERKKDLSLEEFHHEYDGRKPVMLTGLADSWPAMKKWSVEQLVIDHGDTAFRISQRSPRKIKMKLNDYVSYMKLQHDEDPLYIFDEKFADVAPDLLQDYHVPHLFQEDFFDVLDREKRPPFRWLIIGPERSGASWHVDPALTSAWNTLLCGRKRWALYPPGRVPLGVTVHVNEDDGDVNIESPSSLQWWLDYYPLIPDEDKPIEITQLPGETIYVPSGWWHCVLNLELTIAVTQNFVNSKNFEFVCLDMSPGYRHKGVCRAGLLALGNKNVSDMHEWLHTVKDGLYSTELARNGKRPRLNDFRDDMSHWDTSNGAANFCDPWKCELPYDINLLSTFLDDARDHYNTIWSSGNCIGQREFREWLSKLWVEKPGIRDLIWKGACISISADKWLELVVQICKFNNLPSPTDDEKLPVGFGSNPVYLVADYVIKIYAEEGLENSLYGLGTEIEFYNMLQKESTPLKDNIPDILASGIIYLVNGSYSIVPWDGKGLPEIVSDSGVVRGDYDNYDSPFGVWRKKFFMYKRVGLSDLELISSAQSTRIWPYTITRRCRGRMFGELRESMSWKVALNSASFLGEQLHHLHLLPLPSFEYVFPSELEQDMDLPNDVNNLVSACDGSHFVADWEIFIRTLAIRKKDVVDRLKKWKVPIAENLVDKVIEYLPNDLEDFRRLCEGKSCTWIHTDIMDDNIYMEPSMDSGSDDQRTDTSSCNGIIKEGFKSWHISHIIDFSDVTVGDPLLDLIPIHIDVFRGDPNLLKQLLASYKLPLTNKTLEQKAVADSKIQRLSYHAMCYCILHGDDVVNAIFGMRKDLRTAKSWEEIEEKFWGELNNYQSLSTIN